MSHMSHIVSIMVLMGLSSSISECVVSSIEVPLRFFEYEERKPSKKDYKVFYFTN